MPIINQAAKEVTAKIVYYGAGLCGKTTNLEQVHARLMPEVRGRLLQLETAAERTIFFDMMPVKTGLLPGGFTLKFQLLTVPGQVYYDQARRQVMQGADGIVFVADSSPARLEANEEAMRNLYENARKLDMDMEDTPLVIAYNKRDVPGALNLELLQQQLNPEQKPAFPQVAIAGEGVFRVLQAIMEQVETRIRG